MAKPSYNPENQDKLNLYEKLVELFPDVKRKGAKMPYTSANGHMFSFLLEDGVLALRMSKPQREAFMAEFKTEQPISHNTVMKEYVSVPDELLQNTKKLSEHFQISYDYVLSLKPK